MQQITITQHAPFTAADIRRVFNYTLFAGNGRRIRRATGVEFTDGHEIRFTERATRKVAIDCALRQRNAQIAITAAQTRFICNNGL